MNIKCFISKEEANLQVSYVTMSNGWIPVTGDSVYLRMLYLKNNAVVKLSSSSRMNNRGIG